MTLAPIIIDPDARQVALLRAVGWDRLSEPQRELALAIANRYGLDPMLKHLVLIDGRPYITRDGLLHVAHSSGKFDGMETTDPILDLDGKFWRSTCSIFRKDMSRPFTYTGRYPVSGKNRDYAPEMAIKVGEVMALRRAFDVAAPVIEERWAGPDGDEEPEATPPSSLAERVAIRAAAVTETPAETVPPPDAATEQPEQPATDPEPAAPPPAEPEPVPEPPAAPEPSALDEFAAWVKATGVPQTMVKRIAKELFPEAKGFRDLDPAALATLRARVEAEGEFTDPADAPFVAAPATAEPPAATPTLCGDPSPLSGASCTMDAGHAGVHRAGVRESWQRIGA